MQLVRFGAGELLHLSDATRNGRQQELPSLVVMQVHFFGGLCALLQKTAAPFRRQTSTSTPRGRLLFQIAGGLREIRGLHDPPARSCWAERDQGNDPCDGKSETKAGKLGGVGLGLSATRSNWHDMSLLGHRHRPGGAGCRAGRWLENSHHFG